MKVQHLMILGVLSLLLTGCGAPPEESQAALPPVTTEAPPVTAPTGPLDPEDYLRNPELFQSLGDDSTPMLVCLGDAAFGFRGDDKFNESGGVYYEYEGGEMCLTVFAENHEIDAIRDTTVHLFLNGIPQPFRMEGEEEYGYGHTFSYEGSVSMGKPYRKSEEKIYFIPVTGEEGDKLVLSMMTTRERDYSVKRAYQTMGCGWGCESMERMLEFKATPPEFDYDLPPVQLSDVKISYTDTDPVEWMEHSEAEWQRRSRMSLYVNDLTVSQSNPNCDGVIYGVKPEEPVRLRFEVWGSPDYTYGLTFYADQKPVIAEGMEMIPVEIRNGMKTVVEATLTLDEFDGDAAIYALLIPQNSWGAGQDNAITPEISQHYTMVDLETKDELKALQLKLLDQWRNGGPAQ